jgi:hypothetical protein
MRAHRSLLLLLAIGCGRVPVVAVDAAATDADDPWGRRKPPPAIVPGGLDAEMGPLVDAGGTTPDGAAADAAVRDGGPPADAVPLPDAAASDARAPDAAPDAPKVMMPDGCQMVTCDGVPTKHDCCQAWYFFGLESEDRGQVQRNDLVKTFTKGVDVRASYAFDRAGQDGVVGILLSRPRAVTAIRISAESSGLAVDRIFISAEAINGSAGCAYPLAASQADVAHPLFCWGDRAFVPDRINVRTEAKGPGTASIRVTAVEVR